MLFFANFGREGLLDGALSSEELLAMLYCMAIVRWDCNANIWMKILELFLGFFFNI